MSERGSENKWETEKSGSTRNHEEDKERNRKKGKKIERERVSRKVRRRDGISHCKVFRATAGKGEDDRNKDGREDDADARRKAKGAREESGLG